MGGWGTGVDDPLPLPPEKKVCLKLCWVVVSCPKKIVRKNGIALAIEGGMTPPPQNIVGLKLCRVVLSCQKIFFVRKKWEMVNPRGGRGGGNCVWLLWVGGGVV